MLGRNRTWTRISACVALAVIVGSFLIVLHPLHGSAMLRPLGRPVKQHREPRRAW